MTATPGVTVEGLPVDVLDVRRSFSTDRGDLSVLDGVTLAAGAGEFVSLLGPSGSGKSTLLGVLAGLDAPDSGTVKVDGRVVTGHTESFALMPQRDLLLPWRRLVANATLGLEASGVTRGEARARVAPLIEEFGLAGFERAYPHELSGKECGNELPCCAPSRNVDPSYSSTNLFGALDSLTRADLQSWLADVWGKHRWTVLLITHDVREAIYLSDRVFVFSPRPAQVVDEISVNLPRPRPQSVVTTPEFAALEEQVMSALRTHQSTPNEP